MTKITVRCEGHYEVKEAPFCRTYVWHPSHVTLECDCGEELTLSSTSPASICRCGDDHSAIIQDIQEREGRLRDEEVTRPWQHDAKEQTQQHLRDEAAYPEGSPWRYNDVTLRNPNDV
jgi:hypothetical protein